MRTHKAAIVFNDSEFDRIKQMADDAHLSVGTWLRKLALDEYERRQAPRVLVDSRETYTALCIDGREIEF